MILYFLIGLLWTISMDWILKNYSPKRKGFSFSQLLYNLILWPVAIGVVLWFKFKEEDEIT